MNAFLSIDLGTTGLKVALLTEAGKIVGSESCEYPILSPRPGYAEQDPESWWAGLVAACRSLKSRYPTEFGQIAGIGICGQMHTQVYLDKDDQILGPAITWMDQRSSDIVDTINGDADSKDLVFEETRNFATTTYTAPQVKWVKDNQPDVWRRTRRILVAKDFIKFRLTGQMVTDYSEASGTLLFDVEKRRWSEAMFSYFGFPGSLFPRVGPSDEIIGQVTPEASELCGIKSGHAGCQRERRRRGLWFGRGRDRFRTGRFGDWHSGRDWGLLRQAAGRSAKQDHLLVLLCTRQMEQRGHDTDRGRIAALV